MRVSKDRQYSDIMLESMQATYGAGFLSPGGTEEVHAILGGLDLTGQRVLDIGCGVGGAMEIMAGELGAGFVQGVDVESENLRQADQRLSAAGLKENTALSEIDPGPLPFPDNQFDLAYSNDVICHIEDKEAFFAEVLRVLTPGGLFVSGDWMTGEADNDVFQGWIASLKAGGLIFFFETPAGYQSALEASGFEPVELSTNSDWALGCADEQLSRFRGSGRAESIAQLGEAAYERRCAMTELRLNALKNKSLHHGLFRAVKPKIA